MGLGEMWGVVGAEEGGVCLMGRLVDALDEMRMLERWCWKGRGWWKRVCRERGLLVGGLEMGG